MADITRDPVEVSPDGHTEPLTSFKGSGRLEPGRVVTLGTKAADQGEWEVLRVDGNVVHLVRSDRVEKIKGEHRKLGRRDDGSLEVS